MFVYTHQSETQTRPKDWFLAFCLHDNTISIATSNVWRKELLEKARMAKLGGSARTFNRVKRVGAWDVDFH